MSEPKKIKTCQDCGRPKWTDTDLTRWQKENGSDEMIKAATEPEWAAAICWSNETRCGARQAAVS